MNMPTLPKHINLHIEHQPHATNYETVEDWLSHDFAETTPEDRAKMIDAGEVWVVHWYPDTPIGFHCVAAATLERAIELANR